MLSWNVNTNIGAKKWINIEQLKHITNIIHMPYITDATTPQLDPRRFQRFSDPQNVRGIGRSYPQVDARAAPR